MQSVHNLENVKGDQGTGLVLLPKLLSMQSGLNLRDLSSLVATPVNLTSVAAHTP